MTKPKSLFAGVLLGLLLVPQLSAEDPTVFPIDSSQFPHLIRSHFVGPPGGGGLCSPHCLKTFYPEGYVRVDFANARVKDGFLHFDVQLATLYDTRDFHLYSSTVYIQYDTEVFGQKAAEAGDGKGCTAMPNPKTLLSDKRLYSHNYVDNQSNIMAFTHVSRPGTKETTVKITVTPQTLFSVRCFIANGSSGRAGVAFNALTYDQQLRVSLNQPGKMARAIPQAIATNDLLSFPLK